MAALGTPKQNQLLAKLPSADFERLRPSLEKTPLALGMALYEAGGTQEYVYFPTDSIVSLLYVMDDGVIGGDRGRRQRGHRRLRPVHGRREQPSRAVVQSAGHAYRMKASVLKAEFERGGALQHLLLRYTLALLTQMAQTAVCNRHHSVEQQLCRWLLLSLDRLPSNKLTMTQELIANMLGVRREGVTEAAGQAAGAGLIEYSRGKITVLDRPALETRVCECYEVVKRETDRLFPRGKFLPLI